jgi:membrane protease YdiL (CAAX protease family)
MTSDPNEAHIPDEPNIPRDGKQQLSSPLASAPETPQFASQTPLQSPRESATALEAPELPLPPQDGSPMHWRPEGGIPAAPPADLRVPWGMKEIVLFLLFVAVLIELTAGGVSLGLMKLGVTHEFLPKAPRETSIFLLVNQAILFAGIMLYLYLRIHFRYRAPFWSTLQWKPLEPLRTPAWLAYLGCVGGGCTLALVIEAASEHLGKGANMPIEAFFKTRDTALVLMLMSVLLAPLLEETIFRGLLYPVLARVWGVAWGVTVTGILFGLMHSYQLGGSKAHVALLILVGITLTWVRAGTRSVLASFLVHISYNGFLTAGFIASGALRHLPPR